MAQAHEGSPAITVIQTKQNISYTTTAINLGIDGSATYDTIERATLSGDAEYSKLQRTEFAEYSKLQRTEFVEYNGTTDNKNIEDSEEPSKKQKQFSVQKFGAIAAAVLFGVLCAIIIIAILEIVRLRSDISGLQKTSSNLNTLPSTLTIDALMENITQLSTHIRTLDDSLQLFINEAQVNITTEILDLNDTDITRIDANANSLAANLTGLESVSHSSLQTISNNFRDINLLISSIPEVDTKNSFSLASAVVNISNNLHGSYTSCTELPPSFPSGYYWLKMSNSSAVHVYCDMTRSCGGITGGWTRVAQLDMRHNTSQCPNGMKEMTSYNIRTCIKDSIAGSCDPPINYYTYDTSYSYVCGMIRGYQVGSLDGFTHYNMIRNGPNVNASSNYVDGVSLTHGRNYQQHIWTFAAGPCFLCLDERPEFVGEDLFCDGVGDPNCTGFCEVVLWDGVGCDTLSGPWFYKQLPQPTTDDIQMRVCRDQDVYDEDIAIEMIELYIQ